MSLKKYDYFSLVEKFPSEVKEIFAVFLKRGDEIRLVGGSVRDLIYNKDVCDFDFATKFSPQEVIKILEKNNIKAVPTGIKFGTITAVVNGKNFEITTLRKDLETDGRHCNPEFVDDYFLDAARRDFTMNALYLDNNGVVYDYFDGVEDIQRRLVRFIGDAKTRIEEDYLRILRFFRFSCNYALNLDEGGFAACVVAREGLKKLSRERIRMEFLKLISSKNTKNLIEILQKIEKQRITEEIFTGILDIGAFERLIETSRKLKDDVSLNLKIATLFLNDNLDIDGFFKEICATNLEKKYLQFLSSNLHKISNNNIKTFLAFNDKEIVKDLYLLALMKNSKLSLIEKNIEYLNKFSLLNFPLNGNDLEELGFKKEKIGFALNEAKIFWAERDFKANKKDLITFLKTIS